MLRPQQYVEEKIIQEEKMGVEGALTRGDGHEVRQFTWKVEQKGKLKNAIQK